MSKRWVVCDEEGEPLYREGYFPPSKEAAIKDAVRARRDMPWKHWVVWEEVGREIFSTKEGEQ